MAALEWIDEPITLLDGQPVATIELLKDVLTCPEPAESLELVHPSWWPVRRVELLDAAARRITAAVLTRSRAAVVAAGFGDAVVVEIAGGLVAITADGDIGAEPRIGSPGDVADAVAGRVATASSGDRRTVVIDAPAGVGGAAALAALIAQRLPSAQPVTVIDELPPVRPRVRSAVDGPAAAPKSPPHRSRGASAAAAALGIGLVALGVQHAAVPGTRDVAPYVVAGRVAVHVPTGWQLRRVDGGPGSPRVEVVSPEDPQLVLHITQAPAPGDTLAAVAEPLQRGLLRAETAAPGVFVGFDPAGTSAGRPAVTYREVRADHQIDWAVLIDGALRIGIGCQHRPGGDAVLRAVCEQAVRSAHAIG